MGSGRRVAVIGAGPSGLVAAKELLQNGVEVKVFEKLGELGGVWNPSTGCVWNSMHTNISKYSTTFGDFPWPDDVEMFPSVICVFEYLNSYADKFGITERIEFNCLVEGTESLEGSKGCSNGAGDSSDSKWKVSWTRKESKTIESEIFDGLIIATGIFDVPSLPQDIPGLESFPGRILHSREYRNGEDFSDLKVLTVGGSFSGVEIAADIAKHTEKSFHLFRKPCWILRRYLKANEAGAMLPVDLLWHKRSVYAAREPELQEPIVDPKSLRIAKNNRLKPFCEAQQEVPQLRVNEEDMAEIINVVISDDYVRLVKEGKLTALRNPQGIQEIKGNAVVLQNGEEIEVDVILFATGFKPNVGFLGKDVMEVIQYDPEDRIQPVILFHELLHPAIPNLFFVGLYKGPDFAVMEQQARYAARILAEKAKLPSTETIAEVLKAELEIRDRRPRPQFPHPDYVRVADALAKLSGSFPDIEKLRNEAFSLEEALGTSTPVPQSLQMRKKDIAAQFWASPVVPAHYNLVDNPKITANHMDLVDQVVKQFLQNSS